MTAGRIVRGARFLDRSSLGEEADRDHHSTRVARAWHGTRRRRRVARPSRMDAASGRDQPRRRHPGDCRRRRRRASTTSSSSMMENRSFDHFLGWLPGADGRQAGPVFEDGAGRRGDSTYHLSEFQGCGHADPAPLVGRRARRVRQRRVRRMAARRRERRVRDRLLHRGRSRVLRQARRRTGPTCDRFFAAIMGPRPTRTASTCTPRRPTGCSNDLDVAHAADDLGLSCRRPDCRGATTSPTSRSLRCGAARSPASASPMPTSSPPAATALCPTSATSIRDSSTLGHRVLSATIIRTPTSVAGQHFLTRSTTPSRTARTGKPPCSSSPTTSGVASSITSRPQVAPDADPRTAAAGFRVPCIARLAPRVAAGTSRTTTTTTPRSSR